MPLFGSKHRNDDGTTDNRNKLTKSDHHQMQPTGQGAQDMNTMPHTQGLGAGTTGYNDSLQPNSTLNHNQFNQHPGGQPFTNAHNHPGGTTLGGPSGPDNVPSIPPTTAVSHGPGSNGGGSQRITGKVESAIGTLVGSAALKEKGAQKEQEANTIKLQGRELAEAERLEAEALMRRERAVAHGAHPANATLGGPNLGASGQSRGYN